MEHFSPKLVSSSTAFLVVQMQLVKNCHLTRLDKYSADKYDCIPYH